MENTDIYISDISASDIKVAEDFLEHHGIIGMKWGKKNGPPYPLDDSISTGKRLKEDKAKAKKTAKRKKLVTKASQSSKNLSKNLDKLTDKEIEMARQKLKTRQEIRDEEERRKEQRRSRKQQKTVSKAHAVKDVALTASAVVGIGTAIGKFSKSGGPEVFGKTASTIKETLTKLYGKIPASTMQTTMDQIDDIDISWMTSNYKW